MNADHKKLNIKRSRFSGVTAKFVLGLVLWFLTTILNSSIGLIYLRDFQSTLLELTNETLPGAESSANLSSVTNSLTGKVRQLALVSTQVQRRLLVQEIQSELDKIDELTPGLKNVRDFSTFLNVLTTMKQLISRLDTHVEDRIDLTEQKQVITHGLARQLHGSFFEVRGVTPEHQIAVLNWQGMIATITVDVIESSSIERVRDTRLLERELKADFSRLSTISSALPAELKQQLLEKENEFRAQLFGEDGYLKVLVDGLKMTGRVRGIENQVVTFNKEIAKLSDGIFDNASVLTTQNANAVNRGVDSQFNYTLATGIMLLVAAIAVGVYFRKILVVRLNRLSGEVQNYVRGNDQDITISGADEITGISVSIKTFIHEIEEQQAALLDAKAKAEDAAKSKSEFLATMSHEIRTPMNGVVSMTDMLAKTKLDTQQRELMVIVQQSAKSLLAIINDILDFSRIDAGKLDIEETKFSLREMVSGVTALCGAEAYQKGLEFFYDVDSSLPEHLIGDPTRIRQVLLNLVSNAVKFTEKGHAEVRVFSQNVGHEKHLYFEVQDTGIGISSEASKRLFQAFEQADGSTVRKFGGSGLGLSICKRLVELMGGQIGLESELKKGSTFFFSVPLKVVGPTERPSQTNKEMANLAVVTPHEQTIGAVRSAFEASDVSTERMDAQYPESWPQAFDGQSDVGNEILLLDEVAMTTDQHWAMAQKMSEADGVKSFILAPRARFTDYDTEEYSWLTGFVAKPLDKDSLYASLFDASNKSSTIEIKVETPEQEALIEKGLPARSKAEAEEQVILVAEDNIINQKIVAKLLDRVGVHYDIVNDGQEALTEIERGIYGLVLTDFHMPNMDGLMLCKELRGHKNQTFHRIPIVMLTADAQPETQEQCLEAGAEDFLTKPIAFSALSGTINKWMSRH